MTEGKSQTITEQKYPSRPRNQQNQDPKRHTQQTNSNSTKEDREQSICVTDYTKERDTEALIRSADSF